MQFWVELDRLSVLTNDDDYNIINIDNGCDNRSSDITISNNQDDDKDAVSHEYVDDFNDGYDGDKDDVDDNDDDDEINNYTNTKDNIITNYNNILLFVLLNNEERKTKEPY